MKKGILTISIIFISSYAAFAQGYKDSIAQHRQQYKNEFLTDKNSPLKAEDTGYLRFFPIDKDYRIIASFQPTKKGKEFLMPTHSGKNKTYREYGVLIFSIHDTSLTLHVYQSIDLMKNDQYKNYLFIPFTDQTNYTETFGGGRYMDLSTKDIKNGKAVLDFNKCYNPYCAFADGYSCPIPPKENALQVAIKAGEMLFGKEVSSD